MENSHPTYKFASQLLVGPRQPYLLLHHSVLGLHQVFQFQFIAYFFAMKLNVHFLHCAPQTPMLKCVTLTSRGRSDVVEGIRFYHIFEQNDTSTSIPASFHQQFIAKAETAFFFKSANIQVNISTYTVTSCPDNFIHAKKKMGK